MLLAFCLKSKKPHKPFNIHWNLMRIVLFERCFKYLPLLKIPLKKEKFIEVIGVCSKMPKACFEPYGLLGINHQNVPKFISTIKTSL